MTTTRRRAPIRGIATLLALAAALAGVDARAQPADEPRAETLFREGRDALQRDDVATACAKFTASLELSRRASTLLNLAQCEERQGRLVSARTHWRDGGALLPAGDERIAIARERLSSLDKRVPRLIVRLAPDAPNGAAIAVDGAPAERAALEAGVELDPGDHTVVVTAPGRADARTAVALAEGERRELTATAGSAVNAPPKPGTGPSPALASNASAATRRTIGFVIGGVGLAGLVGTGVTGAMVVSNDSDVDANCPNRRCNAAGYDAVESNRTLLVVNAIALGVGVVGLGVGAALVWTSRGDTKPKAALGARALSGGGGVAVEGAF